MLFIAASYFYLNRADPDCGTTFTWVTRAMGPIPGWIGGWAIIVADLLVMPSLASITGIYFFQLFGADDLANNKWWVMLVGVIFILLMTLDLRDRHRAQRPHAVLPARRRAHRSW